MTHNHEAENAAGLTPEQLDEWEAEFKNGGNDWLEIADEVFPALISTARQHGEAIARAEKAEARAESAEQDWANREADTMRLGAQLEDAERELAVLRALIARAADVIEPFNALTPFDAGRPNSAVVQIHAYLSDLRRLAALAADLRKAGEPTTISTPNDLPKISD